MDQPFLVLVDSLAKNRMRQLLSGSGFVDKFQCIEPDYDSKITYSFKYQHTSWRR